MELFRTKLITTMLAGGLIMGSIVGLIYHYLFPQYYPDWFSGSLLFFLILETLIVIFIDAASQKVTSRQLLNSYLLTKLVKIFASLIYVSIYAFTVKEGIKNFVLGFMILYFIFLFLETSIFKKIENRLKNKQ